MGLSPQFNHLFKTHGKTVGFFVSLLACKYQY